jgi:hypothetical protein
VILATTAIAMLAKRSILILVKETSKVSRVADSTSLRRRRVSSDALRKLEDYNGKLSESKTVSGSYWMTAILSEMSCTCCEWSSAGWSWWLKDGNGGRNVKVLMSKMRVGQISGGCTSNSSMDKCFAVTQVGW